MRCRSADGRGDAGTVTAELAVALPAVVLLLAALLTVGSVMSAQLRCQDAARAGARWAARGEGRAAVERVAARVAPDGAVIDVGSGSETVTVSVTARVGTGLGFEVGGPFRVSATATAQREQVAP
jgi:Flp pilus assembly protein TadG